ncbi:glycosyl hydrolase family 28-related protein [Crossiella sp. CA-258035]|uniref:glycosyl hydrolase family 28-related protein n=1 Tax=Crossiella sp. CA-258035 TaxID=2981138 RepID=UPI0024BBEC40|nr:glycosyl hydrolase family 28-related protein [Crossiella sp. CA-258035]WHT19253.1 glycosyl hydrolase family 28-related protein [Crossiella sp. CA-258035]
MTIERRTFLAGGAAAAACALTSGAGSAQAATEVVAETGGGRAPRAALWQEYVRNPHNHPQVPDVSFAGYRTGERWPNVPVRANVLRYGAVRDGSADASAAINAAIVDVGRRGGGAVLLPAGTYRIDHIIQLGYDNVVLRGEGSGRTTLYATRSLEEVVGINRSRYGSENSAWSWAGGLVWVSHRDRHRPLIEAIKAKKWPLEGWLGNEGEGIRTLTTVTAPAARGGFTLTVADGKALHAGQRVLVQIDDDAGYGLLRHMCGDGPGTAEYVWSNKDKLLSYRPFQWPVRITRVRGNQVTLEQPLPVDARLAWKPRLTTFAPPITGAGVEGLTIRMVKTVRPKHLLDKGYNGLAFQCAWDCWADDVTVVDSDNGFLLVATKGVTLSRTSVAGRGQHHSYACREQAHDNLVENFRIGKFTEPPTPGSGHHGINVEGLSCGNVWSKGVMEAGTFDTHRGLPFANVRTEVSVFNDGNHGGSANAGPLYGARFTHWNVTVTNGRAGCVKIDHVAPYSATVGISEVTEFGQIDKPDFTGPLNSRIESYGNPAVNPPNLHRAQRELRKWRAR